MRESRALWKSRGVVELSARQFALDFLQGASRSAPIVAIVVEVEILAAALAAITKPDQQPPAIAFKPRHLCPSSSPPPQRWASESRPCVRHDRCPRAVQVGQG